jgi:catechol 2,3-dioxygenase-like lactoylglutathione lyase family enzyme
MIDVEQIDHIGIRVTDKDRALAFYAILGFELFHEPDFDTVAIIKNAAGVELNLITNGVDTLDGKNVLMDLATKHPGITHVALRVKDMVLVMQTLAVHHITITQGPVTFGDGQVSVFFRDPDRNTIELRADMSPEKAQTIPGLVFYDPKA